MAAAPHDVDRFFYEDDEETNARENYNMVLQSVNYGFTPNVVYAFTSTPFFKDDTPPRVLVLGADACGGGNDEFGIFGGYHTGGKFVVSSSRNCCLRARCALRDSGTNIGFNRPCIRMRVMFMGNTS